MLMVEIPCGGCFRGARRLPDSAMLRFRRRHRFVPYGGALATKEVRRVRSRHTGCGVGGGGHDEGLGIR